MTQTVTRVFVNGNSQAVLIPAEFRLDTDRVQIYRNEQGDLVLHPIVPNRGAALLEALQGFDDDFIAALEDAGTPIGANDPWIACHALADNATLVTHNTREFDRVEGLRVENWVADVLR